MKPHGRLRSSVAAAVLTVTLAAGGCTDRTETLRPNIVFISLDTTRADHIGAYGGIAQTPAIDDFVARSVLFENVSTVATTTLPAHVSMLTGRWPTQHGVPRNGFMVHEANQMLPEILRAAGYTTAGFSAAVALSEKLNFPQGFDVWDQDPETEAGVVEANRDARRAGELTDAAIRYLREARWTAPLFLFVHYVDPHSPYDPPEPYRSLYGDVPKDFAADEALLSRLRRTPSRLSSPGPDEVDRWLAALYAGEVTYMDHHVGRLLAALEADGLFEDALILITADHGEAFWEHSETWSHGFATYETIVGIPLLLKYPGGAHAGSRVTALVSNVDIAPTVLEIASLAPPGPIDGEALGKVVRGGRLAREGAFAQSRAPREPGRSRVHDEENTFSVRIGQWKYVRSRPARREELYDLAADHGERRNLLPEADPFVRKTHRRLRSSLDAHQAAAAPLPSDFFPRRKPGDEPDAEARRAMWQRLEALGYLSEEDAPPE